MLLNPHLFDFAADMTPFLLVLTCSKLSLLFFVNPTCSSSLMSLNPLLLNFAADMTPFLTALTCGKPSLL